jgi:DNA-binding NarL/FixJ family response regulator
MSQRIVLVGHCGVDGPRMEAEIHGLFRDAQIFSAADDEDLENILEQGADLLLVNRELPYSFEDQEGVDAIKHVRAKHPNIKAMLISDHDDAQAAACEAGACPGFGKADLGSPKVAEVIKNALH